MTCERAQTLTIEGVDIYILDVITYEGDKYIYGQEIGEEDLLDKYYIYKIIDDKFEHIVNPEMMEILLKKFVDSINKDI